MRRASPRGGRDEAGERSSDLEKAVEERAVTVTGVAIDGSKGDAAEGVRSPFSARASAYGDAAGGGVEIADGSTGHGAEGDRGRVGARALSYGRRRGCKRRCGGGWQFIG